MSRRLVAAAAQLVPNRHSGVFVSIAPPIPAIGPQDALRELS